MKSKIQILSYILASCIFSISFYSCDDSSPEPSNMVDSGSWYETGFTPWPHDGNPLESENFVVYSDASSMETKQLVSQICEDAYAFIIEKLGIIDFTILKFPAGRNNKIHIYAYKNYAPRNWGGQTFYGGYLIYAPDNPLRTEWGDTNLDLYIPLIRHEMMHVVQTLILGNNDESYLYNWFAEGIAMEISDDNFYTKIESKTKLESLYSTYGKRNPLSIRHSWETPNDIEYIGVFYWYPMYWLSVRYLLDPQGRGGSFSDVLEVLLDGTRGVSFDNSLKNQFGISQAEYEAQFFDLMNNYLDH